MPFLQPLLPLKHWQDQTRLKLQDATNKLLRPSARRVEPTTKENCYRKSAVVGERVHLTSPLPEIFTRSYCSRPCSSNISKINHKTICTTRNYSTTNNAETIGQDVKPSQPPATEDNCHNIHNALKVLSDFKSSSKIDEVLPYFWDFSTIFF